MADLRNKPLTEQELAYVEAAAGREPGGILARLVAEVRHTRAQYIDSRYDQVYRERNGDPPALAREAFTRAAPPGLGPQKPRKPPKKRTTDHDDEEEA